MFERHGNDWIKLCSKKIDKVSSKFDVALKQFSPSLQRRKTLNIQDYK
jgi:hypothetical protein